MKKLFVALAMILSLPAMAEWKTVGWANDEPVVAIDYDRTFNSNGITYTWFKDFTMKNLESTKYRGYRLMSVTRIKINCTNRTASREYVNTILVKDFFNTTDVRYDSEPWTGNPPFSPQEIGSVGEFIVDVICKK